jgi:hypothetical protein
VTVPTGTGSIQVNFSQNGQQYTNSVEFDYIGTQIGAISN